MNKLQGTILRIESSDQMSMVEVNVHGDIFNSIVLETPRTAPYLKVGASVHILFKETEVSIAKNLSGLISLRNRIKSPIQRIEKKTLLTTVILNYQGQSIISIISTKSANQLDLKEKDSVEWLVKTNEISLWPLI